MLPLPIVSHLCAVADFLNLHAVCYCYCYSIINFTMQKRFLSLLIILLAVSHLISATAIPGSRTQKLNREDIEALLPLAQVEAVNSEEVMVDVERRMDLETQDYGGTGANKDHDPKSPGRV
ncbi:hypothetical protein L6164_009221 [Bauhinia variegata]|uniref:Uncharacterized protein n=1 Tax=Bauhinia variegata TaxID=167791 RepID=A0ACB9PIF3_BAUVA|nr:hypothetical protein L6164_009221 [Bauhinia variegata]